MVLPEVKTESVLHVSPPSVDRETKFPAPRTTKRELLT